MVNYKLGKIYKIISDNTDKIYIGSTCAPRLCQRLSKHVSCYNNYTNYKRGYYFTSYNIIEKGNYRIILVEEFPCNKVEELTQREQFYIDLYRDICVNKQNASGINKEKEKIRKKIINQKYKQSAKSRYLSRIHQKTYLQKNIARYQRLQKIALARRKLLKFKEKNEKLMIEYNNLIKK